MAIELNGIAKQAPLRIKRPNTPATPEAAEIENPTTTGHLGILQKDPTLRRKGPGPPEKPQADEGKTINA